MLYLEDRAKIERLKTIEDVEFVDGEGWKVIAKSIEDGFDAIEDLRKISEILENADFVVVSDWDGKLIHDVEDVKELIA